MPPRLQYLPPLTSTGRSRPCILLSRRGPTTASFHSSRRLQEEKDFPNHYQALELEPNASPADIKRQFYTLSKKHHPDLARSHPSPSSDAPHTASTPTRFHQINEAYHVLGKPEARARYDRDYHRHFGGGHASPHIPAHPRGSFSSATGGTYAGSRPPSGLSRRRSPFRGPPPSFYQQGGYGKGDAARDRQAAADADAARAQGMGEGDGSFGGFDRLAHKRTQEGVASTQSRSRASRRRGTTEEEKFASQAGDTAVNFFLLSGIIAFIAAVPLIFTPSLWRKNGRKRGKTEFPAADNA